MATKKIYYENPYITTFQAKVVKAEYEKPNHFYVVLDQTAFYPEGGGQPYDTGTLNDLFVYDVQEIDGEVRHYIKEPLQLRQEITGKINWERRFDHMQQHAGQHILTAAFEREFGYKTVSFHLGSEHCTIDLDTAELTAAEISQVEKVANDMILENREIITKWVDADELSRYPLRKEISVTENIRLVIIPDFDYNGCGGTHPDSTGQVSSIKILHTEKQKKKIRVYFVCGNRVLNELGAKHDVIQELSETLSAPQEKLNQAAIQILEKNKQLEKQINELKAELLKFEAEGYLIQAEEVSGFHIIKDVFSNRPMSEMQQLAKQITASSADKIVIFVNEANEKLQLVCARGEGVEKQMNELIKEVLPSINGKGGGSVSIAQGGGEKLVTSERLIEVVVDHL